MGHPRREPGALQSSPHQQETPLLFSRLGLQGRWAPRPQGPPLQEETECGSHGWSMWSVDPRKPLPSPGAGSLTPTCVQGPPVHWCPLAVPSGPPLFSTPLPTPSPPPSSPLSPWNNHPLYPRPCSLRDTHPFSASPVAFCPLDPVSPLPQCHPSPALLPVRNPGCWNSCPPGPCLLDPDMGSVPQQ